MLLFLVFLLGFSTLSMLDRHSSSLLHATTNAQDTTTVEYWKQKAKIAMKELAQQEKLAAKCVAEKLELKKKFDEQKRQLEECKSKK